jgi:hypothetical protein
MLKLLLFQVFSGLRVSFSWVRETLDFHAVSVAVCTGVSTSDQSCDMQLRSLREYVARQGWQVFQEYVDTGSSGTAASRPRLDQLLRFRSSKACWCGSWIAGAGVLPTA